jgi:hypothetical protein
MDTECRALAILAQALASPAGPQPVQRHGQPRPGQSRPPASGHPDPSRPLSRSPRSAATGSVSGGLDLLDPHSGRLLPLQTSTGGQACLAVTGGRIGPRLPASASVTWRAPGPDGAGTVGWPLVSVRKLYGPAHAHRAHRGCLCRAGLQARDGLRRGPCVPLRAGQQLVGHHRLAEPNARGAGEGDPPPGRRAHLDLQLAFLLPRIGQQLALAQLHTD